MDILGKLYKYLFNLKIALCALPARVTYVILKEPPEEKTTPK